MLKQAKPKDSTLDEMSEEDDFSDLAVLEDSISMYMVSFVLASQLRNALRRYLTTCLSGLCLSRAIRTTLTLFCTTAVQTATGLACEI